MTKSVFPIVEVNQNIIHSVDGDTSFFYQMNVPDLEQLTGHELDSFYSGISRGLNNLENNQFYKFYKIGQNSYLNTSSETTPEFNGVTFTKQNRPLQIFFENEVIFSDIAINDDYISYNGRYLRIFSILGFSDDEFGPFTLPNDLDYVITVKKHEKSKSISKLERIRSSHLSSFLKSKKDIASEGAYNQAEELLADIIHGHEELFDVEIFFILKSDSPSSLNNLSKKFVAELSTLGIKVFSEGQTLKKAKSGLAFLLNNLIPGVIPRNQIRLLPNKSSHLRYLLPLNKSQLMDEGVIFHDINDYPIQFNPFDKNIKNRNMLVTGLSGGGKSVFVNKLVHSLIDDYPTVILDKGGSFKKLTKYHEGAILNEGFNPFQFKDPLYLRELILSLVDKDDFNKLERGKLLKVIKENICNCDTFADLIKVLKNEFHNIDLYFEEFKDFFNNAKFEKKDILYVDLEDYPKGIITPLIIYILEYFKQLDCNNKILVFDECWTFLKDHSSYIDECFRTFRKSGAFPIAISQSLNDFSSINRELANSITNNSYFKIFFPQELELQSDITEFDLQSIKSLEFDKNNFSECYLKTNDNKYRKIIRTYLNPIELQLFHTEAGEDSRYNLFLEKFNEFFTSTKQATHSYVRLIDEKTNHPFYFNS